MRAPFAPPRLSVPRKLAAEAQAGARVVKVHPSGGTVDTGIGAYDDPRIKAIYQKAIGART